MTLFYHVTSVLFSEVWCSEGTSFPPQVLAYWTRLLLPEGHQEFRSLDYRVSSVRILP